MTGGQLAVGLGILEDEKLANWDSSLESLDATDDVDE
jgi:hypothetical protein